ncbi:MAG: PAS domain-containing protein [Campylobacterota bacterium]|nr:PAS domain-containing protein [Campylobacterota bacterium]
MKAPSFFQKIKSPLSKKLLLTILISSTIITFTTLSIQLYFEYKTDIELIEKRISQIENSYTKALALSVWNFNKNQYEIQLDGILNLEDIVYVEIVSLDNKKIISKGIYQESQKITQEFVLQSFDFGERVTSGKLIVVASLERVYDDLYTRAFIILVTQGIKTLLVSLIILYAFYLLVTRHLYTISEYTKSIDLDSKEKLDLQRKNDNDELDNIVFALNNMQNKINNSYKKIEIQKRLYDLVFEKSSSGVLMMDAKSKKFIECNDRIVTILKANSKDDVLNMHPLELSPEFQPDGRRSDEKSKEMIQKAIDKGVNTFEWKHIRTDGEVFWAEIILTRLEMDSKLLIYVTWKDIDDTKKAQLELVEKSALLAKANTQLQESQYKLQQANKNLESKVQERTQELQQLNRELTNLTNSFFCTYKVLQTTKK